MPSGIFRQTVVLRFVLDGCLVQLGGQQSNPRSDRDFHGSITFLQRIPEKRVHILVLIHERSSFADHLWYFDPLAIW